VIVRSKEDSNSIAADRYDYMRAAGTRAAAPQDSIVMPDYGTPVLPPLVNGQPPAGGAMAPVPPRPVQQTAPTRPGPGAPAKQLLVPVPMQPQGSSTEAPLFRPVQPPKN